MSKQLNQECSGTPSRREIEDLYQLAQIYTKTLTKETAYVRAVYLSYVSPIVDNILEEGSLKVSRGHVPTSHEKTPIEHLPGIVFAADTKNGSIWNDGKLCILPNVLINKEETNLYFGNFFCYTGYTHFVTLVVTRDGSEEDKYCSEKLVRIDVNDNLYFRAAKNDESSFNMISGQRIVVEIMYAHDLTYTAGDGRIWAMPAAPDFQRWENDSSEPWRWCTSCDICNVNPCGRNGRYKNPKLDN
ncbi:phytanoyl-CoA hydroxylase-interacting protein-like [Ditylenchus destructor]|uniref:Phytanoyl-CoA hydroxylase-interacting protein-like n=1 Tax=Ditylenchus destructor TaxID=166010 RepID=A0AAD4R5Y1_9BILA|nr:phytanoyl-CoA hydroxylase-interacting protein-like [Ditylenchus destructor]